MVFSDPDPDFTSSGDSIRSSVVSFRIPLSSDLGLDCRSVVSCDLDSGASSLDDSDLHSGFRSDLGSGFVSNLDPGCMSDLNPD